MAQRVLVPIADGSEEIETVCIIDTLRRAGAEVTVASVSGRLQVTASRGTKIVADRLIEECLGFHYDLIALPGGMPGAEHLRDDETLIRLLKAQQAEGRAYGAICAAPAVVLLPHGLLAGHRATCFPSFLDRLREAGDVEALTDRVVIDGNVVTSQGPGTALEFALALVDVLFGDPALVRVLRERMLVK